MRPGPVPGAPLFIVNPASAGGRTKGRVGALIDALERGGLEPDCLFTTHPGHAALLAREAIEAGRDYLVACGGDGTVHEIAGAILHAGEGERVRLGTVPMGTGKDVAKCLDIPRGMSAIRCIAGGHERRVDAGRVTARAADGSDEVRYFLLEASAGWVPETSRAMPSWLKRLGDTAPALLVTAARLPRIRGRQFTLTVDGQAFDGRYNTISVHNMERWGGDLVAAPGAEPDDGLLDVVRWGDLGRAAALKAIKGQREGGSHIDMEGIDRHPARSIECSSPRPTQMDLDGEPGGFLPARIEVVPRALRFVVPAPSAP